MDDYLYCVCKKKYDFVNGESNGTPMVECGSADMCNNCITCIGIFGQAGIRVYRPRPAASADP